MFKHKLFIFDLDGTIVDSESTVIATLSKMLVRYGRSAITTGLLRPHISKGGLEMIKGVFGHSSNAQQLLDEFRSLYLDADLSSEPLYEGVVSFIVYLRSKGMRVALCTNKPAQLTKKVLSFHGIADRFDYVITADDVSKRKPDPEGLLKILKKFDTPASQTFFIGDSTTDAMASKAAKIGFIFHANGYNDGVILNDVEIVCHSFHSLKELTL